MSFINKPNITIFINNAGSVTIATDINTREEVLISLPLSSLQEVAKDLIWMYEEHKDDDNEVV